MRSSLFRLLVIACFFVILKYALGWDETFSLLTAFVIAYITEPWILSKL